MSKTWLVLDCNYLCYRAQYTTGRLTNGVVFGFFRDVVSLMARFGTSHVVFCWDHGRGLRQQARPSYKQARRERKLTSKEQGARKEMQRQVELIKTTYVEALFSNNFYDDGYEADDLIAGVCLNRKPGDKFIIVSADHDLYQLLKRGRVMLYNPHLKKLYTQNEFEQDYDIGPHQWALVKAVAGCKTDGVEGVRGVGEKTACLLVRNNALSAEHRRVMKSNLPLVELPYEGCPDHTPMPHELDQDRWQILLAKIGLPSLAARVRIAPTISSKRLVRRSHDA